MTIFYLKKQICYIAYNIKMALSIYCFSADSDLENKSHYQEKYFFAFASRRQREMEINMKYLSIETISTLDTKG